MITDGSHPSVNVPPSTAIWDWDGTTLTSAGLYSATLGVGDFPWLNSLFSDQSVDLVTDTGTGAATATSYACVEGNWLAIVVGANACGGYNLGTNSIDESTTIWSGTSVSQTIGGDDVSTAGPRTLSAYDFDLVEIVGVNGLTIGDQILIGKGIPLGTSLSTLASGNNAGPPNATVMTFQAVPIPAAFWLFGSALGLLGWMRRKAA